MFERVYRRSPSILEKNAMQSAGHDGCMCRGIGNNTRPARHVSGKHYGYRFADSRAAAMKYGAVHEFSTLQSIMEGLF